MNSTAAASSSATSTPFCPACGHNLEAEQPVELGALRVDPRGDASFAGRKINFTCGQFLVFSTIAQARGALVRADVLADRAGYDGDADAGNVVDVHLCRIRRALRAAGCPPTIIRRELRRGWAIDVELLLELEREHARKC